MHIQTPSGDFHLSYCTNIHAGHSWAEISRNLDAHLPTIKAAVSPDAPMGVGLRLSADAAAALAGTETFARFRDQLDRLQAYVFTINAFPFGHFHQLAVKEQVYEPDWRTEARVRFTADAATILARLLPEGGYGSISTVPGAFKPVGRETGAVGYITENLLRTAAHLVSLARDTGRTVALALEPEPCCLLETVEESIAFFEQHLFRATPRLAAMIGTDTATAERALRTHIGVCYDVCHGAVEFEDSVAALHALRSAGIAVPKIQLSAALRIAEMSDAQLASLARFDNGVYLHQTVVRSDGLRRFTDLPDAFAAWRDGEAAGEWRIHCHVPVFLADPGALGSTQADLLTVLGALREEALAPHLEVETYTWDVLPAELRTGSQAQDIARELNFVLQELRR